jgi:hypothetical protein
LEYQKYCIKKFKWICIWIIRLKGFNYLRYWK